MLDERAKSSLLGLSTQERLPLCRVYGISLPFWVGEGSVLDSMYVCCYPALNLFSNVAEMPDEPVREDGVRKGRRWRDGLANDALGLVAMPCAEHIVPHEHLPVRPGTSADADSRYLDLASDVLAQQTGHGF